MTLSLLITQWIERPLTGIIRDLSKPRRRLQRECLKRNLSAGYLNEAQLRPWFKKSMDLQFFSLVGYCEKINAFLFCTICFNETVHHKWSLDKSVGQTENDLERSFVKHWLKSV